MYCAVQHSNNLVVANKYAVACIASLVGQYVEVVAKDLESFAKHAKRTTIAADDVRLCARRMPDMVSRPCPLKCES